MKTKLFAISLLLVTTLSCQKKSETIETTATNTTLERLDANSFAEQLKANPKGQLLDIRTPEEFESGHLDQAQNLNWNDAATFDNGVKALDKNLPVFVYCMAGSRSTAAAEKLQELGFTTIYELEGGYMKWRAAGLSNEVTTGGMTQADLDKILATDKKVLIDFYTTWCGPCKKLKPILEKISEEMKDKVVVVSIDAEANMALAESLKVEGYPTLILYQNKKPIWRNLGFLTEEELKKQL
ncbi:MAG: hypothetical protein RL607_1003 [Bacteroidota bacterium]|jgi:thioredoxin